MGKDLCRIMDGNVVPKLTPVEVLFSREYLQEAKWKQTRPQIWIWSNRNYHKSQSQEKNQRKMRNKKKKTKRTSKIPQTQLSPTYEHNFFVYIFVDICVFILVL